MEVPLSELPLHLDSFPRRWDFPRGDLYHWIKPLNRFDDILQELIAFYGLDDGPQTRPFGLTYLLTNTPTGEGRRELKNWGFEDDGDWKLAESILNFSRLLLEKCGNRSLYDSGERLNALLNTTSLPLLHTTLKLALCLAQRYHARHRPTHINSGSLTAHYGLDLDRIQCLAALPPTHQVPARRSTSASPEKASKAKTKLNSVPHDKNPNDLISLSKDELFDEDEVELASSQAGRSISEAWKNCVRVHVTFQPESLDEKTPCTPAADAEFKDEEMSSPSPLLRHHTSPVLRDSTPEASLTAPNGAASTQIRPLSLSRGKFEPSLSSLQSSSVEQVVEQGMTAVPKSCYYELLHQLRIAYSLLGTVKERREWLAVRLLAVSNLAYISSDATFQQRFLNRDRERPKRQQFAYQIADLLHLGSHDKRQVPLNLQVHASKTLQAMTKQRSVVADVNAALNVTANHGTLLFVLQEGIKDTADDGNAPDSILGDEWREAIFSMPQASLSSSTYPRAGEMSVSSQLVSTYVKLLNLRTRKAQRIYLEAIHFFDAFLHHTKEGLAILANNNAFDAVVDLLGYQVEAARESVSRGNEFAEEYRTPSIDYRVPYTLQQAIRSILPFVNGITTQQGHQADRALRSLIDSQDLLSNLRVLIENGTLFGAHIWSEAVKVMTTFLNNEPTSYSIIAESGLSSAFLDSIMGHRSASVENAQTVNTTPSATESASAQPASELHGVPNEEFDPHLGESGAAQISCVPKFTAQGVLPAPEAIANIAHAFSAICLTSAGSEFFQASGALEKFFEIFESPIHIKVMKDATILQMLGNSFDEFVRHHPSLKSSVMSAILVMVSRIRWMCKWKFRRNGVSTRLQPAHADRTSLNAHSIDTVVQQTATLLENSTEREESPLTLDLPNGKKLVVTSSAPDNLAGRPSSSEESLNSLTVSDCLTPMVSFLIGLFENSSLCTAFLDAGGADLVLDLPVLQDLPHEIHRPSHHGGLSHELAQVVHMMAETKPHIVLPILLERSINAVRSLEAFLAFQPETHQECFVDPVVEPGLESRIDDDEMLDERLTIFARSLVAVHILTNILSEVFSSRMYHSRSREQPAPFFQVNLADRYVILCQQLGTLSAACSREAQALDQKVPLKRPNPAQSNGSLQYLTPFNEDVQDVQQVTESSEPGSVSRQSGQPFALTTQAIENGQNKDREKKLWPANLQTVLQLHYLLPRAITRFFAQLGHGLAGRKRLDTYQKQSSFAVGRAIATALIHRLDPSFFRAGNINVADANFKLCLAYFVEALKSCSHALFDFGSSSEHPHCLIVIALPFMEQGGVDTLKHLGHQFHTALRSNRVSAETVEIMTIADVGLKNVLSILEHLTSAKSIVESGQSNSFKVVERSKPYHYNPAQFLLELRLAILPFVRMVWDSSYAEQSSKAVLEKLIAIFRHILGGDQEQDADREHGHSSIMGALSPKRFVQSAEKINNLKSRGYDEDLVREALFRCNNHSAAAEEYCRMFVRNQSLARQPLPSTELESSDPAAMDMSTPEAGSLGLNGSSHSNNPSSSGVAQDLGDVGAGQSLLDLLGNLQPNESTDSRAAGNEDEGTSLPDNGEDARRSDPHEAEDMENTEPDTEQDSDTVSGPPARPVDDKDGTTGKAESAIKAINTHREELRSDLIERCLNIVNSHFDVTWELSELVKGATKKLQTAELSSFRETASTLLVTSLVSLLSDLEADDYSESTCKKVPACAHFVALVIQDKEFYEECLPHLQQNFSSLLRFFHFPSQSSSTDAPLRWIGHILLILERMLSDDAEPAQVTWHVPASVDAALPEAAVVDDKSIITKDEKISLFQSLLDVLPRIRKEKSLALSVSRVLVILTRDRRIALEFGERRNLQRLFVMMKQLANMATDRIQSAVMLILRHIIEDDGILRQIIGSEIVATFEGRGSRQIDTTTYVRNLYHLVLRSPDLFVQVTQEKLKIQQFDTNQRPQTLVLKSEDSSANVAHKPVNDDLPSAHGSGPAAAGSKGAGAPETVADAVASEEAKTKTSDIRAPVVDNPDGVIHLILSQLLSYKDVEDNDSNAAPSRRITSPINEDVEIEMRNASVASPSAADALAQDKQDRLQFLGENHPIFIYRCFLLQCLTELLHAYNRAKIEFINFSRKLDPVSTTPSKPRSGVLNYLLNSLIPLDRIEADESVQFKKRTVTSEWAVKVIVALCSRTGEHGLGTGRERQVGHPRIEDNDSEPELAFVRRFVLEHTVKSFKDASFSNEPTQTRYAKMLSLASLFHQMLSKPPSTEGIAGSNNASYLVLARMMFEKNLISVLTSALAEIDLTFPGAKRVVKYILKPLHGLTATAVHLSFHSPGPVTSALGQSEDGDLSSASSLSEAEASREETPDLFRNSALGMLEPNREDASTSESEPEEEDDEMYEGEYADDMEFDDDVGPVPGNDGEVVSDEDVEEGSGPGPMEGLPGDVPMGIELVMSEPPMGMDSGDDDDEADDGDGDGEDHEEDDEEDDEDEDDDDEDDEDDEDEDDDDFLADIDDMDGGGEINADDENDSLADNAGDWLSENHQEPGIDEGDSQDDVEATLGQALISGNDTEDADASGDGHGSLNNLLHILGESSIVSRRSGVEVLGEGDVGHGMHGLQDEHEEDGDDHDEDLDENEDDLAFQTFHQMLNPAHASWPWDDGDISQFQRHHHASRHHHTHFRGGPGQYTSLMSRHLTGHGLPMPAISRPHRSAPPARPTDDGTNPLLQHPGSSAPPNSRQPPPAMDMIQSFGSGIMGYFPGGSPPGMGSGGMLDAIMEAMQRGSGRLERIEPSGRFNIHVDTASSRYSDVLVRSSFPPAPRSVRDDPHRIVLFNPLSTTFRWQEEARLLFGLSYVEKTQRVVNALLSVLVPPAMEEEKARQKKMEEEREREQQEQAKRERMEKEEKDRKQKQQEKEEEEARREQAAERARLEAEQVVTSDADVGRQEQEEHADEAHQTQDAETSGDSMARSNNAEESGQLQTSTGPAPATSSAPRTFTTIRGQQLDVTNMSIDFEYLEALPEELREEVIMQQYAEQRHQAEEQGQPPSDINREFLEALPEDIREELLQQEASERRRREQDAARRRAVESGSAPRAEEMDADTFMATLDPELRRSILADQSDEVLSALAPVYAAEARDIVNRQLHHLGGRVAMARNTGEERSSRDMTTGPKEQRKQVPQMVDRAGVATLMRLMFLQQQGSASNNLHALLHNVCQHRQTRAEVISLLLSILQDGSADISAVEKSLAQLSLRAKVSSGQKPTNQIKGITANHAAQTSTTEMTPLMVVQQCLAALSSLIHYDAHVASVFLREMEPSTGAKTKLNRKGKTKENRASRFAINALISLLDRKLVTENSMCMESLSSLLATITQPLTWLLTKDKGKAEVEVQDSEHSGEGARHRPNDHGSSSTVNRDITMTEPSEPLPLLEAPANPSDTVMADATQSSAPDETAPDVAPVQFPGQGSENAKPTQEHQGNEESRSKKFIDPPFVPEQNLQLIIGVLAARECSGKTFRDTLSTINALSLIPGAKDTFGQELVHQSQSLSTTISAELNKLLESVSAASAGNDVQSFATAKFSPAGADQAKLLRVLTALDYLFDLKRVGNNIETGPQIQAVLSTLYESPTFSSLWAKLGDCLSIVRQKDGMLSVATILLPLIEALMVVCKNTSLTQSPASKELAVASPTTDSGLEGLFFTFTTEHRKILNELVRQNSKLMNGSFSLLAKNPKVLEFDNKRTYFARQIHSKNRESRQPQPPLQLSVRRDQVFLDSFKSLYFKSAEEMKFGKLSIRFHGEEGVDAGGVTREWFQVLARGMFNPNYALFIPVASDRTTFHPNRLSGVNSEHLLFFKFIGRIIGKAIYEGRVLDCHFSRAVYKRMLGKTVSLKDMETLDLDYYKSLVWMLENDITDIITESFSIESNDFGESQIIDLIENGRNIPVTEENKQEYIQLVVEYRLTGSVQEQLENFLRGFHDIVPAELISVFTEQELELLISGLPDIDLDDWKANTEYHNYNGSSPQIQWFWRAVRSFDQEEQAKLLQFVTGTSKVPLNGFKELEGMNGFSRFNIHKEYGSSNRLPSSHTCFNREYRRITI